MQKRVFLGASCSIFHTHTSHALGIYLYYLQLEAFKRAQKNQPSVCLFWSSFRPYLYNVIHSLSLSLSFLLPVIFFSLFFLTRVCLTLLLLFFCEYVHSLHFLLVKTLSFGRKAFSRLIIHSSRSVIFFISYTFFFTQQDYYSIKIIACALRDFWIWVCVTRYDLRKLKKKMHFFDRKKNTVIRVFVFFFLDIK